MAQDTEQSEPTDTEINSLFGLVKVIEFINNDKAFKKKVSDLGEKISELSVLNKDNSELSERLNKEIEELTSARSSLQKEREGLAAIKDAAEKEKEDAKAATGQALKAKTIAEEKLNALKKATKAFEKERAEFEGHSTKELARIEKIKSKAEALEDKFASKITQLSAIAGGK